MVGGKWGDRLSFSVQSQLHYIISGGWGILVQILSRPKSALNRVKPIRVKSRIIDGENEAHLLALNCREAPEMIRQNEPFCLMFKTTP